MLDKILEEVIKEVSMLEGNVDRCRLIQVLYYYIARHTTQHDYWVICDYIGLKYNTSICTVPPKYISVLKRILDKLD